MSKPNMSALQARLTSAATNLNKANEAEIHARNLRMQAESEYEAAKESFELGVAQVSADSVIAIKFS